MPSDRVHVVTLAAGQVLTGIDFGNQQLTPDTKGEFRGLIFYDINSNGTPDDKDYRQPIGRSLVLYLDQNQNGQRDADERFLVVHGKGDIGPDPAGPSYNFTDLNPGTYTVTLEREPGWRQTSNGGVVNTPPLYAIGNGVGDNSSNLYRIDDYGSTPRAVPVGETGVRLRDLAIDPIHGRAFGISDSSLYALDLQTGAASLIGPTGVSSLTALAFSPGTLYAMGSGNPTLYRLDPATGVATAVLNTGYSTTGDLAFDTDGSLYLTTGSDLVRIDIARSEATLVGPHGVSGIVGLGVDFTGTLIGLRGSDTDATAELYSIHKGTGTATLIGNVADATAFGAYGMSFDAPRIVPDSNRRTYQITITGNEVIFGVNFGIIPDGTKNSPPIFTSAPPTSAKVGQLLRYDAAATDLDQDPLRFDLVVKPAGMTVEPETGILVWVPSPGQEGIHDVTLRVQDTVGGTALQSFRVIVEAANTTPVISSIPKGPAVVGLPWQYQVTAQDADGDTLTFALSAGPSGMTINPNSGLVNWTPTAGDVGSQHVAITADDGHGAATTQSFDLPVVATSVNHPPTITSTPPGSVRLGGAYRYVVQASDPDSDPLSYSLTKSPAGMSISDAGLVTWAPSQDQFGANDVAVQVADGRGGSMTQPFAVNVLSQVVNHPPTITSTPGFGATVGVLFAYDTTGTDPDNDVLAWSLDTAPDGMSVHPGLGTVRWTPTTSQLGNQNVVLRVSDPNGGFATQSFTIIVRSVNLPPAIISSPPTTASANTSYTYPVQATDPEGGALTFALTQQPAGMTINATSGLIQWTPTGAQLGTSDVTIQVIDPFGAVATQKYQVVVSATAENHPPVITSTPSFVAVVGSPYVYQVTATDSDGDTPTFLLLTFPAGMTINPTTGLVNWTPTTAQLGSQQVSVGAVDSHGAGGSQSYTVTVVASDTPPSITSSPVQIVNAGSLYRYDVRATDPDGDPLNFSLTGPAGMTIDKLGRVAWATTLNDAGIHRINITVADNHGLSQTQSYDLDVRADKQAPVVHIVGPSNPLPVGAILDVTAFATDNVGVTSLTVTIGDVPVALDADGHAEVLLTVPGVFQVVAQATDAAQNVGQDSFTLTVFTSVIDPNAPIVEITSPVDGAILTAPTDVIGTVQDVNLVRYVAEVCRVDDGTCTQIFTGTSSVINGVLGKLNTVSLANDSYILRVTAEDAGGNRVSKEVAFSIAGELKLGNFRLSFTDLSIPVNGIPITVARTYDTLNASREKDLGFGWRLEFRHADLRTSVPRTLQEEQDVGIFNPFKSGSRVYVTLPGGKREGFTFQPKLKSVFAGSIFGFYDPVFVPDAGVTSRLSVGNYTLQQLADGSFYSPVIGGALPFNPEDELNFGGFYTLSTKDGVGYQISARSSYVQLISDPNGNTLTFTDESIVSSSGPKVTFERDFRGRIIGVVDPTGQRIQYEYDANGDLATVKDREGNVTTFLYGGPRSHYLTEVIDPLGRTGVKGYYDDQGRLVRLEDAQHNPVEMTHDLDNSRESVKDPLGHVTIFTYDERGNVTEEENALGGITKRTYDLNNFMTSETDPLGHKTAFTYDGDGNVLTRTDPLGNKTVNTYISIAPGGLRERIQNPRPVTLLAATIDALGNTTQNGYDGNGNLTSTTDAAGNITSYTYDGAGNQTSITDALNKITKFEYDGAGHLLKQTDALNHETAFTYDDNGNQLTQTTTVTTPNGPRTLTTATIYDKNGRPVAVTDAEGNTTQTEYDALGKQSATVDSLGRRTEFKYDERGQLTETKFADGSFTKLEYDAAGRRIASTDRAGRTTHFEYDPVGRLVKTVYPDDTPDDLTNNPFSRTEYDLAGRVSVQIDERAKRTEFTYDDAGRQTSIKNALNFISQSVYDAAGRKTADIDALNRTTRYVYDALGRRTETQFADNTKKITTYDALGRVVAETDQANVTTQFEYDGLGRLIGVLDALNGHTEYTYNEPGNLLTQKDAKGRITKYEYDGLGRRVTTELPLGQRSTTTYDGCCGTVHSTTDFNGKTIQFEYDLNNRPKRKSFPDGSFVEYSYTPAGRRSQISKFDVGRSMFDVWHFAYDPRDRLLSRTDPDGRKIAYEYDLAGNRTKMTTHKPDGSVSGVQKFTFDDLNRLATVTDPDGGVTEYTYNEVNSLRMTKLPNGSTRTDTFDALNRVTSIEHQGPAGLIARFSYTLDATGRRTRLVENTGRTVNWSYDQLSRLTQEAIADSVNGNRTIDYAMDAVGNRLTRVDSVEGTTEYEYDNNDQLLSEKLTLNSQLISTLTYSYDPNGNTLSRVRDPNNQAHYTWDFQNRLTDAEVVEAGATKVLMYDYDDDGIRVAAGVGEGANNTVTRYLIDANRPFAQVVEEWTSLNSQPSTLNASYTHGPHHLISQSRAGARSYFHADHLGSTRALTDPTGGPTDRYDFDAYGRLLTPISQLPTPNSYLFVGEQRDKNLNLDYLRARYLNFNAGRFYGRDQLSGVLGRPISLEKFLYSDVDPVNHSDPSGKVTLTELTVTVAIVSSLTSILQSTAGITGGSLKSGKNIRWEGTLEELTAGGVIFMGIFAQSECNYSASPPNQIEASWLLVGVSASIPSLPGSYFSTSVTILSPRIFGFNPLALTGGFVGGGVGVGFPLVGATGSSLFTMGFGIGYTAFSSPTVGIGFGAEVFTGFSILGGSIKEPCGSPMLFGSPLFVP